MKSNLYNLIRFIAVIVTLLAVLAQYYAPKKQFDLHPSSITSHSIYSAVDPNTGRQSATWISESREDWACTYTASLEFGCGYSLSWGSDPSHGMDLSRYDGFKIKIHYSGSAERIRLFIRNFNSAYATADNESTTKFMSTQLRTNELDHEIFVKFSEFSVAEWWITENQVPRQFVAPEFTNIFVIGVDHVVYGTHRVRVEKIQLVGDWVKTENFLLGIIGLWMVILLWEGLSRFYRLYQRSREGQQLIVELVNSYQKLETEKNEYEVLSTTDVLTGVCNRAGIMHHIQTKYRPRTDLKAIGLMIIDIDHFKRVNDVHGHDVGDKVLISLVEIIVANIRQDDVFGRWGGEEFVLLCPISSISNFRGLADKLCGAIEQCQFGHGITHPITVSIGAAVMADADSFDITFKRADEALYQAKNSGRNRVVYAN
jgi:diguanylate cyclase (GGDEF) domain